MAVYDQTYRNYTGELTTAWSRFFILPRYAYRTIFQSRLFTGFYLCLFVYPLIASILIYLRHNSEALAILQLPLKDLLPINARFFLIFLSIQSGFGALLTLFVAPHLILKDVANNAVPLYLCRPFSRTEYVLGKMSVTAILLSTITWIPGLLLFALQSYLEGGGWMFENARIAGAIFVGAWAWIFVLTLGALAFSAWVKRRMMVYATLVGVYMIPSIMAHIIHEIFETRWGFLLSVSDLIETLYLGLFGFPNKMLLSMSGAWFGLLVMYGICLFLLSRKVQAYEVIR